MRISDWSSDVCSSDLYSAASTPGRCSAEPRTGGGSSNRERVTAAATGACVRITNHELRTLHAFFVVDLGTHQVLHAHRVDQQGDAIADYDRVVIFLTVVELEAVLEARADRKSTRLNSSH